MASEGPHGGPETSQSRSESDPAARPIRSVTVRERFSPCPTGWTRDMRHMPAQPSEILRGGWEPSGAPPSPTLNPKPPGRIRVPGVFFRPLHKKCTEMYKHSPVFESNRPKYRKMPKISCIDDVYDV